MIILKFRTLKILFMFSSEMLVFMAGIHKVTGALKMLVKIATRKDPDQTVSTEAV